MSIHLFPEAIWGQDQRPQFPPPGPHSLPSFLFRFSEAKDGRKPIRRKPVRDKNNGP